MTGRIGKKELNNEYRDRVYQTEEAGATPRGISLLSGAFRREDETNRTMNGKEDPRT